MKERLIKLIEISGLSTKQLEERTDINRYKWGNVKNTKQRINENHIKAAVELWPEYAYWLTTGKTIPEAGQISPEIEETRNNLKTAGKAS